MTTTPLPGTTPGERPVSPAQLAWLEEELAAWRAAALVDDVAARAIRSRYVAVRRFSLARLLLHLGGAFLGVGLLWLVATNLDTMPALLRFAVVTALWLGFVVAAEVLAGRRAHREPLSAGATSAAPAGPVVGACRLLASVAFGAVVFQAAQSLQVPAYEPLLVGVWGLGALLYAYAVGGIAPQLVGIAATTSWYVWEVAESAQDGMGFVLPILLAATVTGALALLHRRGLLAFAASWREASAVLVLVGLFAAAFPSVDLSRFSWSTELVLGVVVAGVAMAAAVVRSTGRARWEPVAPVVAVVAGVLLVLWEPDGLADGVVGAEGYAHAFVSVGVYVLAAGWYAVLGVLRDSSRLTAVATAALVLFTTVQSFAVFAPIVTGATLFLVLGVVLLGTGYLFDRGRRRLVGNLEGASA